MNVNYKDIQESAFNVKEKISQGKSLSKFIKKLDLKKDEGYSEINCKKIYLLNIAIKGKEEFYKSSLYGKICRIIDGIFGSSIKKAQTIINKFKDNSAMIEESLKKVGTFAHNSYSSCGFKSNRAN